MTADAGADAGGDLRGRDADHIVSETLSLSGGNRDIGERHENPVRHDHLQKLGFVHILRVNFLMIDGRSEAGAGKGDFRVRIFFLQQISMHPCSESIFSEIIKS